MLPHRLFRVAAWNLIPVATILLLTLIIIRTSVNSWANVLEAITSLYQGAFGSTYDIGVTLNKTAPLILTGLGVSIAFRARMWNIGGEGQFLVGALAAMAAGAFLFRNQPPAISVVMLLFFGAFAGAIWAGLSAVMRVCRGVPEVISTIMLNFIAVQLLSYLVHGPMQVAGKSQPSTEPLPEQFMLPVLIRDTTLHAGLIIAVIAVIVVILYLYYSVSGFSLKVAGANASAAHFAGINVKRTMIIAMIWSGALCGLAGAVELSGVMGSIYENYSPGYGFTAIAVALLGRLHPAGVMLAALFFGALIAGCGSMERHSGVSSTLSYVIQAVTLLVLLAFYRMKWNDKMDIKP